MTEPTTTVVVIAKEPRPGRAKTRLQQRFSPSGTAALAEAALADTLEAVAAVATQRRVLVLDGEPGTWLPEGFEVLTQRGQGLDERLAAAFDDVLAVPGSAPALLVGMDTPQLTPDLLTVDWTGADVVLGPADDGGYWAIGFREPCRRALVGVPMSTPGTSRAQLERLTGLGLRVRLLPTLCDVDTPADAARVAALAPATRFGLAHARLDRTAPAHPVELYEAALDGEKVFVRGPHAEQSLNTGRWVGDADAVDELLLDRCEGPVLDVGCGPGRLVAALCARGVPALGVDVSAGAIERSSRRGANVLRRDVHSLLPGEGRWGTVVLADGNVGIGGDPDALLWRCAELLQPGGLLLVEADPDDAADDRGPVVLHCADGRVSRPLAWARLGSGALAAVAARQGFSVLEEWRAGARVLLAARSLRATA